MVGREGISSAQARTTDEDAQGLHIRKKRGEIQNDKNTRVYGVRRDVEK